MRTNKALLVGLLLLVTSGVSAQDLTGRMETFHVRDARIHDLVALPDGLLMASSTGIIRLDRDGHVVQVEDAGDSGLGGVPVDHLVEGPEGELWASGLDWLARSDGPGQPWSLVDLDGTPLDFDVWEMAEDHPEPGPQRVTDLAVGPDGAVWFGTTHGVVRYAAGVWDRLDTGAESPGRRYINALGVDLQGRVYAAHFRYIGNRIHTYLSVSNEGTWASHVLASRVEFISEIVATPEGGAWVVRYHGMLELFDGATPWAYLYPASGGFEHLAFLPDGTPIGAGPQGVAVFLPGGGWGLVTDEVRGGRVAAIGEELWAIGQVPSLETGGHREGPAGIATFEIEMTPTFYSERATVVGALGREAWAAGEHGLSHYRDGAWAEVPLPDGEQISLLLLDVDRTGGAWVSLRDAIGRYADGAWEVIDLPVRYPYHLSASPDGAEVWVSTQSSVAVASGLRHRTADGTWTTYTSREVPMPHNRINDIEAVGPGEAWYSSPGHLVHLRDGAATDHTEALDLRAGSPGPKLAAGPDGTLYAARRLGEAFVGDELFWFDGQEWQQEGAFGFEMAGRHTIRINRVSVDPQGRPWVLTNWGLSVLVDGVWRPYRLRGLTLDDTVSLAADGDGVVWIGDYGGVHRFEPEALPTASAPEPARPGRRVSAPYPNPTAGLVRLDAEAGGALEVIDLLGRVVRTAAWEAAGAVTLDLSGLPAGPYLVRVLGAGGAPAQVVVKR